MYQCSVEVLQRELESTEQEVGDAALEMPDEKRGSICRVRE
jgi:hypothetical protein